MNVFKSFEIFLKEPLSILKNKFINIVSIETESNNSEYSLNIDITDTHSQLTVINNPKMYKLLTLVNHKANKEALNQKVS